MYPSSFDLYTATSVRQALDLLKDHDDEEVKLMAGGHSLLPTMKTRLAKPDVVVDISGIDSLRTIEEGERAISIGALATFAIIGDSDLLSAATPALVEAARSIGDRQVRNMGTIGGNIAQADPASDLPGAIIAADATVVVRGPDGERSIGADDFFLGMYHTDVGPREIITRIEVPNDPDVRGGYVKRSDPASGYAVVGVAARMKVDGGTVEEARVGANGVMDHGIRLGPVETALTGAKLDESTIESAAGRATEDLDVDLLLEGPHTSAPYRGHLLEEYTRRVLRKLTDEKPDGDESGE